MKRILFVMAGVVTVLPIAGWLGLRVEPAPFAPYPERTPDLDTVPLPDGLPAPVERFYRTVYGERVPVIESAVFGGPASIRQFGIPFNGRYRFVHEAGQGYRHYIEVTLFGMPPMKINEWYLDGDARLELPVGVVENEPKVDQAANLGLWGEALAYPAIYITDPRVRWEAVDELTARLIVPFGDGEESVTVSFDPDTGLIRTMEAMRWKKPEDTAKTPWRGEVRNWQRVDGQWSAGTLAVTWLDDGTPWAVFTIDDLVHNVDVSTYIRKRGL
jgi:hypothetical protein